jgi:hypothetical protein
MGARPDLCAQHQVRRYPTWTVGGHREEGVVTLERLAELSGFRAP